MHLRPPYIRCQWSWCWRLSSRFRSHLSLIIIAVVVVDDIFLGS